MPPTESVLLRIRPSLPNSDEVVSSSRGPLMMETVLSSVHSLEGKDSVVNLEIGTTEGKIAFFARSSRRASGLVESQLYGQYPDAEMEEETEDPFAVKDGEMIVSQELTLDEPEVFPIKRYTQFVDVASRQLIDPIAGVTSALVRYSDPRLRGHIQITVQPLSMKFRKRALKFLPLLHRGISKHWKGYAKLFTRVHLARGFWKRLAYFPLDMLMGGWRSWFQKKTSVSILTGEMTENETLEDEENKTSMRTHEKEDIVTGAVDKVNRLLFAVNVRVSVIGPMELLHMAEQKVEEISGSFRQFSLPQSNGFEPLPSQVSNVFSSEHKARPFLLSAEEVATLWHMPNILVKTPNIDWVTSRKLEPPVDLPIIDPNNPGDTDLTMLGEAVFRGRRVHFGIRPDDRRRHMYVIGKTGMGKSTILENMIFSDIQSGKGVAVIDPHGDLIEACLKFVPKERTNDVILVDPADRDFPVAFNMLACRDPEQQPLVASGLMSVFKKLWPEAFSGRMEYILRNALLALIEAENQSMLGIMRIFSDAAFRRKILANVKNHMVKTFWEDEFTAWSEKYQTEALAAIQNKIGQLLSTPLLRNIIGQVVSKLDLRFAMDTGKIVLVNLSKGKLGEDNSAFLGSMLVTKFQLDAMSRADTPEKDRRDFYLYVDEFQNFATESFATILSEARKYRLNLTMAHQYVNQLLIQNSITTLRDAVFGNVGSMVVFQVGSDDAEPLSEQFEEMVLPKDILSLPKYHAYFRLMIKGIPSKPFSVHTLPPPQVQVNEERIETIRRLSRERYAEDRKTVEDKIAKWVSTARESASTAASDAKMKEKTEEEMKKAKAKNMTLEQYRAWRDREMWCNDFNALRKRAALGDALTPEDQKKMTDLEQKLVAGGGLPAPSKSMISELEKASKPVPAGWKEAAEKAAAQTAATPPKGGKKPKK